MTLGELRKEFVALKKLFRVRRAVRVRCKPGVCHGCWMVLESDEDGNPVLFCQPQLLKKSRRFVRRILVHELIHIIRWDFDMAVDEHFNGKEDNKVIHERLHRLNETATSRLEAVVYGLMEKEAE